MATATTVRCALPKPQYTLRVHERMVYTAFLTLLALGATASAQDTYHCNALEYAQPGFRSNRRLYPPDQHDPRVWDDMHKVSFQNSDCTWLAANFKDTGSSFVAILFAGFTQHKVCAYTFTLQPCCVFNMCFSCKYKRGRPKSQEDWPQPELALYLANSHGLSSLAVDPAGRGESCGYEYGPGYDGLVRARTGCMSESLPCSYRNHSYADCRLAIWQQLHNSPTACRDDMLERCLV